MDREHEERPEERRVGLSLLRAEEIVPGYVGGESVRIEREDVWKARR